MSTDLKRSERMVLVLMACAFTCILLSLLVGAFAALYYIPEVAAILREAGISLAQLRPLHTTFASAWIFLGAVTCVHKYLFDRFGEPTPGDRLRFKVQMACWGIAGLGILLTLPFGIGTGREYLGFHPAFSALILGGWILFAVTFFSRVRHDFWSQPVYVYMWAAGMLYFIYTFVEGHAWLIPALRHHPVADLQVQWKSCGTLVASFNQMVYGSLVFVGARVSGDERLAHSRATFALFGIGLLNSFTNYVHHTYHVPQSHLIKWIAFVVSMLEILILVGVFREVAASLRKRTTSLEFDASARFILLSKRWNLCLLFVAILISVPPLNALIHGTHVVMAHAMGSELAIDSYILFGVFAFLFRELYPKREVGEAFLRSRALNRTITGLNVCLVCLVGWLFLGGLTTGVTRFLGVERPAWMAQFPYVFALFGFAFAGFLLRFLLFWLPLFLHRRRHRAWYGLEV